MTFPVMMFMAGILQLLTVFLDYKMPHSVTGFNFSRAFQVSLGISTLSLTEYFIFSTFYSSYLLSVLFGAFFIGFIGYFIRQQYFCWLSKNKSDFKTNTTDALFYLHLKVRQFCSTDQVSNTFFYKRDGLIVFFGEPDTTFNAMDKTKLQLFEKSLTQSTMGHIDFGGFVVIKDNHEYISLSSDEFSQLNVAVTDISQDHLKLVHMARI